MQTNTFDAAQLIAGYEHVRERVADSARKAGRAPDSVTLLAVSKYQPIEKISTLAAHGHVEFGENYVQEAMTKQEQLQELSLHWHFIGHLQSNKAKFVAGQFDLIHTVDSEKLAQSLHKSANKLNKRQKVLIQVNVGNEPQKAGVAEDDAPGLVEALLEMPGLALEGLMCIPPFFDAPEAARPYFAGLRALRDRLEAEIGISLPQLSMGMSGDLEYAVAEGATIVRVGTDIFGSRPARL